MYQKAPKIGKQEAKAMIVKIITIHEIKENLTKEIMIEMINLKIMVMKGKIQESPKINP